MSRGRGGQLEVYYPNEEIEARIEAELARSGLLPTAEHPVVDLERFIEHHLKVVLNPYEPMDPDVLGHTAFPPRGDIVISINRALTEEAADDLDAPVGIRGRWRATLAHEASHVLFHARLYPRRPAGQLELLPDAEPESPPHLQRCLRRDVESRSPHHVPDWKEVQANKGMAALLMPRKLFGQVARSRIAHYAWDLDDLSSDSLQADILARELSERFQVSLQACRIRLQTLKLVYREEPQLRY